MTLVVLPLARRATRSRDGFALFESIERGFARQVRYSVPLAGFAGLWMTYRLDLWSRFAEVRFWWMDAMLILWLAFMAIIFVVEPLLGARLEQRAARHPDALLRTLHRAHAFLLACAALTGAGAVMGSHGFDLF